MAKATIVKLAENIPVTMKVKYADIFPGEHGPQLSLKGAVEGGEQNARIYLDAEYALNQLVTSGALAAVPKDYNPASVPESGFEVKLQQKTLAIVREKPAGAKGVSLKITVPGAPAATASPTGAPAEAANGGNGRTPTPREKRTAIYLSATHFVLDKVVPLYEEKKIPVAAENVAAMVNTIYIAETRN